MLVTVESFKKEFYLFGVILFSICLRSQNGNTFSFLARSNVNSNLGFLLTNSKRRLLAAAVAGKIRLDNINDNVIFYYKFFRLVGLGYRAYKVETGVLLIEVGYSHYCILVLRDLPINFLVRKDKLLFYSTNRQILSSLVKHFLLIKPLNPYTLKGVRFLKMSYVRKLRKKDRVR